MIEEGWYIVENQHGQSGNAFWDGQKWTNVSMIKGSCMYYDNQEIISWIALDQKREVNTKMHDRYK